jgi:hypothetical protein
MGKIITEEVEFKIKIDNSELSFWEYRQHSYKSAYENLGYGYYNDNIQTSSSPIETLFRDRIKKVIGTDDAFVVVTGYSEREGSFLVAISFFVFATFMSYGSFRESLDYLRDDFNFFFRDTFPSGTTVNVNYSTRRNRAALGLQRNLINGALAPIYKQLNILKALIGFIGIVALGFAFYSVYKVENSTNNISDDTIQKSVQLEIQKANTERVNEELLRLLKDLKSDTTKMRKQ